MRKTSQDGGDATSATSGVENEIKKPKKGLLEFKSKKIGKRTAPNLSEECDDAVVEPLLQKNSDKTNQSAKYFAKAKADTVKEISKLFSDKKAQSASTSGFGTTESLLSEKDQATTSKLTASTNAPLYNHMNTNVFHSHDNSKANGTTKSQVLVEIDASKQSGYNPSPLIFTTAKIHTDGKTQHMEPVQMTPAPISSTVEVSVSKGGNIITNEKKISNGATVKSTLFTQPQLNEKVKEVQVLSSKLQQNKELILTDNNSNPTTTLAAKVLSPTQNLTHANKKTEADSAIILKSNNITSVAQNNIVTSNTANSIKSSPSFTNQKISSPSETIKSTSMDVKNKPDAIKDVKSVKSTKKLIDEPRILMSESKLKSTISENTKQTTSVTATKPTSEPIKSMELLSKLPQTVESNKNDIIKPEKSKPSLDQDIKVKSTDIISSQPIPYKNIKSPVSKDHNIKSNTIASKTAHQKSTTVESSTSKIPESTSDLSAKTLSSSTKIPTQSKVIDSKLSKEIDKSLKSGANETVKPTSKLSLSNTATPKTNKTSTVKPVQSAIPSSTSTGLSESSNKNINSSSPSNLKTINAAISTSTSVNIQTISPKIQSTSSKTTTGTVSTKSTPVTSTQSTKSSATSIKSPQISAPSSAPKQSNITKTASVKPPPLAFTKTPQVSCSSPGFSAPVTKPAVSKVAQVSTSTTTGHTSISSSVPVSSTTSNGSSTKSKTPATKKADANASDQTKDIKTSKSSH